MLTIKPENRKKAEAFALKLIDAIDPGNKNVEIYTKLFANMNDEQFATLVEQMQAGTIELAYVHPALNKSKVTVENNIKLCERMGYKMHDYAYLTDPDIGVTARTLKPVMMTTMYIRRQAQTLEHKNSIPADDRHTDQMTDQATGPSKGASITAPELPVGHAQQWEAILKEIVDYRGGNARAYKIAKHLAIRNGEVSQETIRQYPTSNKTINSLSAFLFAAHIDNNLRKR